MNRSIDRHDGGRTRRRGALRGLCGVCVGVVLCSMVPALADDVIFSNGVAAVEALRKAGSFAEALTRLGAVQAADPARAGELSVLAGSLKAAKREAQKLRYAQEMLASPDPQVRIAVADAFEQGAETGRILLRRAVREGEDAAAARAAELLAGLHEPSAFPDLAVRLTRDVRSPARAPLSASLLTLSDAATPEAAAGLWDAVRTWPPAAQLVAADLLDRVVERCCTGDTTRLDAVARKPGLTAALRAYVGVAMACTNDAAVAAWGVARCTRYGLAVPGLRGAYFAGTEFGTQLLARVDAAIDFPNAQFGLPDKRDADLSVRWTGWLLVTRVGAYTFRIPCDDGHRLWIDDRLVSDLWDSVKEGNATLDLTPGLHPFRLDYKACPAPNHIRVLWKGPDGTERVLGAENLRAAPLTTPGDRHP